MIECNIPGKSSPKYSSFMSTNLLSFRFSHIWRFFRTVKARRLFLPPVIVFIARAIVRADGPDANASGGHPPRKI